MPQPENPFVFGEVIDDQNFVNRTEELGQLVRDLADGQKVFLLSPRRFGKSSLVSLALLKLLPNINLIAINLTASYSEATDPRCDQLAGIETSPVYGQDIPIY
jgi:predicted AAA+ superfamily ATPase